MQPRFFFESSFVAALLVITVIAAPTFQSTSGHPSSDLEPRSSGELAVHFNQRHLIKRKFNTTIVAASIASAGAGYAAACTAFAGISAGAGGFVCGIGAFALLAAIAWANWAAPASKIKRDVSIEDPRYWGNVVWNFDPELVRSNSKIMAEMYQGDSSVHVAYHDCSFKGCYDIFYENYFHAGIGRQVHKLSQKPRGSWAINVAQSTNVKRHMDEQASDVNDPETEEDGTAVYADYIYWDDDASDEEAIHNGEDASDFQDAIYTSGANQGAFPSPGYYCVSILDESDSGAVDSTGYVSISENTPEADPDNEQSYLEQCYDREFGKRRSA